MGSSASKEKVAPLWTSERGFYGATAESRIKDLSASASAFLKPHPAGTRGGVEDLEAAEVRAMLERATRHDPRISLIWLPRLVPKRVSELQFWRNYFSHVQQVLNSEEVFKTMEEAAEAAGNSRGRKRIVGYGSREPERVKERTQLALEDISRTHAEKKAAKELAIKSFHSGTEIRWGIIGTGDVVRKKSGLAFQAAIGSKLLAVTSRNQDKCREFAAEFSIPKFYASVEDLLRDPEIDAVYIATPPSSHMKLALLACQYGKPCLIEKPMARSAYECNALVEAFWKERVPLFVACYRRGHDRWKFAKRLVDNHLGTITSINMRLSRSDHLNVARDSTGDDKSLGWRVNAQESGGGKFMDLAPHQLDLLDFLVGPLVHVRGDAVRLHDEFHPVENVVHMTFQTQSSALGTALWNFVSPVYEDSLEIIGTHAKLSMSVFGTDNPILTYDNSKSVVCEGLDPVPKTCHADLVQDIVNELRGVPGTDPVSSTGETHLRTAKVMDSVLRSFYRSRDDNFWERPETWRN